MPFPFPYRSPSDIAAVRPSPAPPRAVRPLGRVLAPLGLQPPPGSPAEAPCALHHAAPGQLLCEAGESLRYSLVICRGLALRRRADGTWPRATAVSGPREVHGLRGCFGSRHFETLTAVTSVEFAAVDARLLLAGDAGSELLGRIVAGPQSAACLAHWHCHSMIARLGPSARVRGGLARLAALLAGRDEPLLAELSLSVEGFAQWLGLPPDPAAQALRRLQAEGVLRMQADAVRAVDAHVLRLAAGPAAQPPHPADTGRAGLS